MKLIYIAGKYTGNTYSEIDDNIKKARKKALELIEKKGACGIFPVTPHLNTAHFDEYDNIFTGIDYKYWIRGTSELLLRCDGILLLEEWEESEGAMIEHELARQHKIPVYFKIEDIK